MFTQDQVISQPHRERKLRGCCASVLIVLICAAATAVWIGHTSSYSRFRVVLSTDPVTHCRVEYSVSSRYAPSAVPALPAKWLGYAAYSAKPLPTWIAWIESHLAGRSAGTISVAARQLIPGQTSVEDSLQSPSYTPSTTTGETTIECKHLMVSGCPAIWTVTEWPGSGPTGHRSRTYFLDIHPLHRPVSYFLDGFAKYAGDQSRMRSEMISIRDSIKITGL